MPSSIRRAMTASICASLARSLMTTTMTLLSDGRTTAVPALTGDALGAPRFVDNPLEDPHHRFGGQRTREIRGGLLHARKHLGFAVWLVDGQPHFVLQPADF